MRSKQWVWQFTMIVLIGCGMGAGQAFGLTVTKLVDTGTLGPGGTQTFWYLGAPAWDGSTVVFTGSVGEPGDSYAGVFMLDGGVISALAVVDQAVPGSDTFFETFCVNPSVSEGLIAFCAMDSTSPFAEDGIYDYTESIGLGVVADESTAAPGGTGTFDYLGGPTVGGDQIAFAAGDGAGVRGAYVASPLEITLIADTTTTVPGASANFANGSFGAPSVNAAGDVAFYGQETGLPWTARKGVYFYDGTLETLDVVVDSSMSIPGESSLFMGFSAPVVSDSAVAFGAAGSGGEVGIYSDASGSLSVVADNMTPIPDGDGNFTGFDDLISHQDGNVAFRAFGSDGQEGVYLFYDGSLMKLVDLDDLLDGKAIDGFDVLRGSLAGDGAVFHVEFQDNSEGIYVAQVPEPGLLAMHFTGLVTLLSLVRYRRRGP